MNKYHWVLALLLFAYLTAYAQKKPTGGEALSYIQKVTEGQRSVNGEMLAYISAVAHGKSAKHVAENRSRLMNTIAATRERIGHMKDYEGDTLLRTSAYHFYDVCYHVLKEDYGKVMDLEDIAEQSYDNMEAYIKAQDQANKTQQDAFTEATNELKAFATKHQIELKLNDSEEARKSKEVNAVISYYNKMFLILYRCSSNEGYMVKAMDSKEATQVEKQRKLLVDNAATSIKAAQAMGAYEGDPSMLNICLQSLKFYDIEATQRIPMIVDFMKVNVEYKKLKGDYETKPAAERGKEDAALIHKKAEEVNKGIDHYNQINAELNQSRNKLTNDWNQIVAGFMDRHIPHYR